LKGKTPLLLYRNKGKKKDSFFTSKKRAHLRIWRKELELKGPSRGTEMREKSKRASNPKTGKLDRALAKSPESAKMLWLPRKKKRESQRMVHYPERGGERKPTRKE